MLCKLPAVATESERGGKEFKALLEEVWNAHEALRNEHDRVVTLLRSENEQLRARLEEVSCGAVHLHKPWLGVSSYTSGNTQHDLVNVEPGVGLKDSRSARFAELRWTMEAASEKTARPGAQWDVHDVEVFPPRPLPALLPEAVHGAEYDRRESQVWSEVNCTADSHTLDVRDAEFFDVRPQESVSYSVGNTSILMRSLSKWTGAVGFHQRGYNLARLKRRIQRRLGFEEGCIVSPHTLHRVIEGFGVHLYTVEEMADLIQRLNLVKKRKRSNQALFRMACRMARSFEGVVARAWDGEAAQKPPKLRHSSAMVAERPGLQQSFTARSSVTAALARSESAVSQAAQMIFGGPLQESEDIEVDDLVSSLLDDEMDLWLSADHLRKLQAISEVLASGHINKIVSELTGVSMDDLVLPKPGTPVIEQIEPTIAFIILINGILLGLQSHAELEDWNGWKHLEHLFIAIYSLELLMRLWHYGLRKFFFGKDGNWNWLDFGVITLALAECTVQETWNGQVLRCVRLTRLARVIRVLRFRCLNDLTLMLKGLLGGFRTLGWAMVLFLTTVYIISLFVHSTISRSEVVAELFPHGDASEMFGSVPRCMFTVFRCFTGDCSDSAGVSILVLLSTALGWPFKFIHCLSVVVVTFGIFNLIIAVYLEAVLSSAKDIETNGFTDEEQLRIAHTTKSLMKRIVNLLPALTGDELPFISDPEVTSPNRDNCAAMCQVVPLDLRDDLENDSFCLTEAQFRLAVQDRQVETYLDELEIPVGSREAMFDVIDSDNSGTLQVGELVHGLLRFRGEPKKSDTIACLLSIRCLQRSLQTWREELGAVLPAVADTTPAKVEHLTEGNDAKVEHVTKGSDSGTATDAFPEVTMDMEETAVPTERGFLEEENAFELSI